MIKLIKLSIVIPYYETYELTYRLLKELSIQVTDEVEVILVDDGCNETRLDEFTFANILHLDKNYGASHAWNVGIDKAVGKYIAFIDSDDMIMMNYVEELIKAIDAEYADEILFNFLDSTLNKLYLNSHCRAIWKAIYKRSICPHFDEAWKVNTDIPFQRALSKVSHSRYYLNKILYCYNSNRKGSITWRKHNNILQNGEDAKL